MKAKKGIFTLPTAPGRYEAYYYDLPGSTWNGEPQPLFTYEEAYRLLYELDDPEVLLYYDELLECFVEDYEGISLQVYAYEENTVDGKKRLYGLGNQAWAWRKEP